MEDDFVTEEIVFDRELNEYDLYTPEGLESSIEDDCISIGEQGFMEGYLR